MSDNDLVPDRLKHLMNNDDLPYSDNVDEPLHYSGNGMQAIDAIESFELNFHLGNALKYIVRCDWKGNKKEDLEKAIWYLNREINNIDG
jgi:hypothetical protein